MSRTRLRSLVSLTALAEQSLAVCRHRVVLTSFLFFPSSHSVLIDEREWASGF